MTGAFPSNDENITKNSLPLERLCRKGENGKNVMLNLFQHLINSMSYETLNQVQGDKKAIATQSLDGGG